MELAKKQENNDSIQLTHPKYNGKFIFGNNKGGIVIVSNQLRFEGFYFYGFYGLLNIPSLNEFLNKPNKSNDETQTITENPNFIEIMYSIKSSLLKKLLQIIRKSPNILYKHRQLFINIASDSSFYLQREQLALAKEIPVYLVSVGWKKLGELYNKRVYVERVRKNTTNSRLERAACMGFNVVRTWSKFEKTLVKIITGAKDLDQLSDFMLNDISTVEHPTLKEKKLLKNAGDVIRIMLAGEAGSTKVENNNNSIPRYLANSQSISHDNKSSNVKMCKIKQKHSKPPKIFDKHYLERDISSGNKSNSQQKLYNHLEIDNIELALCELDREDINALTNPIECKIFINLRSPIIQKILTANHKVQKVLLIEELSHELAHILGYGLNGHNLEFFKKQRILKYKTILNLAKDVLK